MTLPPFLLAAALLAAGTSAFAADVPLYRATLAAPAGATLMVHDVRWTCMGSACAAPRTASAPDTSVCTAMVRKVGALISFAAADRVFDADQLAKCNAAAAR